MVRRVKKGADSCGSLSVQNNFLERGKDDEKGGAGERRDGVGCKRSNTV